MSKENITNTWNNYSTFPVIIPECADLLFLLSGIYGMNQGIEIGHPIYAGVNFTDIV